MSNPPFERNEGLQTMLNKFIKGIAPAAIAILSLGLSGCDMNVNINGGTSDGVPLAELDMTGDAPTDLVVAGPDKVIITEGETLDITVDGDTDAVAALRFELKEGTLSIGREDDSWDNKGSTTVNITMPKPESLTIGGAGRIETPTVASKADVNIGGSGFVSIAELDSETLDINIGGSGEVTGTGKVAELDITIGGNGDIKFANVQVDDADITIGGSGNAEFASDGTVDATIGGSGTINVVGNAKCDLNAFGSGTLKCQPKDDTPADTEVASDSAEAEASE
jgi:carbon monoxide dehydrogenase subunit G